MADGKGGGMMRGEPRRGKRGLCGDARGGRGVWVREWEIDKCGWEVGDVWMWERWDG